MKEQRRVFQKLSKINKVELSSIKELNQAINILKNAEKDADKVATKFEQTVSDSIRAYSDMVQERNVIYRWVYNEAPARISDFKNAAKELGINANDIPEVKELEKWISEAKEVIKAIDGYTKPKY